MTKDAEQMPGRVWLQHDTPSHKETLFEMAIEPVDEVASAFTPYVRADLFDAQAARNADLEAEVEGAAVIIASERAEVLALREKVADLEERLRKADKVIADLGRCVAED